MQWHPLAHDEHAIVYHVAPTTDDAGTRIDCFSLTQSVPRPMTETPASARPASARAMSSRADASGAPDDRMARVRAVRIAT